MKPVPRYLRVGTAQKGGSIHYQVGVPNAKPTYTFFHANTKDIVYVEILSSFQLNASS